jgi:hypothetical protein
MIARDHRRPAPKAARRLLIAARAASLLAVLAAPAAAQINGVPVIQNAFLNRGLAVAANYGSENGGTAFGVAGAYSPRGRRFVLSGGVGAFSPEPRAELGNEITYGVRLAVPVLRLAGGAIGVAPFAGVGSASFKLDQPVSVPDGGEPDGESDATMSMLQVPVGMAIGYRRALGETRSFSVYASPFYSWSRRTHGDSSTSRGLARVSLGLDVALMQAIGLTLGYEFGATASADEPGPRTGIFGAGLSYALGARRSAANRPPTR